MRFTETAIRALKPKPERFEVRETGRRGFGLRVSPSGLKTWIYVYHFDGKPRRLSLGTYPEMSLVDAHQAHADARQKVKKGIDPGAEKRVRVKVNREALTVEALCHEYVERWAKPKKVTWREDERVLQKDVIPSIGHKKAKDVTRRDIIQVLDKIVDRGKPAAAERTHSTLHKMFAFAVERDLIPASPVTAIRKPERGKSRERFLSDDEIKIFLKGLDAVAMTMPCRLALKLLLATAARRGEVLGARWAEFDLEGGWWTIPASRTKNECAHRVPLIPFALDVLEQIKIHAGDSEFLFPSPRTGTHIDPRAVTRALKKAQDDFKKIKESFTVHDLRRTVASGLARIGVSRLTIKRVLNHVEGDVTAVYVRYEGDNEKREALEAWGVKLEALLSEEDEPAKVISLHHRQ